MIIGITGSIGTGKSIIANSFKNHGFVVINADLLYHQLLDKNKELKEAIKKEFKTLDRSRLRKIVFNDKLKLRKLNKITHPIILRTINEKLKRLDVLKNKVDIVIEAPLLFETGLDAKVEKIIVVKCDEKLQIDRAIEGGKYTKEEVISIIQYQIPIKEKLEKADYIIDNSGSIEETEKQIIKILNSIQKP
jgi:dephospho-CoA kinase